MRYASMHPRSSLSQAGLLQCAVPRNTGVFLLRLYRTWPRLLPRRGRLPRSQWLGVLLTWGLSVGAGLHSWPTSRRSSPLRASSCCSCVIAACSNRGHERAL